MTTSTIDFKGTRWFKCDLHLHTVESKCFRDKTVTAEQWVQRAIDQGLNCVAVTDHNSGNGIDAIQAAAAGTGLVVFPGVEITCDTSKVHLLILFDVSKGSSEVNDFLIRCGIQRSDFADQNAFTAKSINEVAEIAHADNALVIPAHIDEYNGLGQASVAILKDFYALEYINAVQVVHKEFLVPNLVATPELKDQMNAHYGSPNPAIDDVTLKSWYTPVKYAQENNLSILTFSDNPHGPQDSKHGLDGIGSRVTWIKMDENPTLEGLRQALLMPKFRVKNDFDTAARPYKLPDLWIRSISIQKTKITDDHGGLVLEFSPQLNTIIGGRGSGKSSVLRFIRGLFNRVADISALNEILADHNDFYKKYHQATQKGVLTDDTVIIVGFIRNGVEHRIQASNIISSTSQSIDIQKYDAASGTWVEESASSYLDFFEFEHYSQKQIYEIAQSPNSLKERIDKSIQGLEAIKNDREVIKRSYLEQSASVRRINEQISGKGKLTTEIKDLDNQIALFTSSGIAGLLTSKEKFTSQDLTITAFLEAAAAKEKELNDFAEEFSIPKLDLSNFEPAEAAELRLMEQKIIEGYASIGQELKKLKANAEALATAFKTSLATTVWKGNFENNADQFEKKKAELLNQGVDDISKFETLTESRLNKNGELDAINLIESTLASEITVRDGFKSAYLSKTKEISRARIHHVQAAMQDEKIKVSILPFRNKADFVEKLRGIIQRPSGFESDIEQLANIAFGGNTELKMVDVKDTVRRLREGDSVTGIGGHFMNVIKALSDAQMDELELLWPDDEIDIKYKPSGSTGFKPLSTASAGQKTTAILTFILSQGKIPLLLDQPEDDLDNRLVYELIVDRLKQAKEYRQIIVVTHNANIPVNGDAEYILSMDSESKRVSILHQGTVEDKNIKKEICDVMEGSEHAFDMRSKRYKSIL